jgi:predicted Zn-dependent protease
VVVATRAGYEPYGLPRILVKLGHMNPQSGGLQLMTSTHPPAADRLSRLQQIMTGGFERYGGQPLLEQRYAQNLQHLFPH